MSPTTFGALCVFWFTAIVCIFGGPRWIDGRAVAVAVRP